MKAAFTPGTTFASYRVESLLGRGGMGVVYLAQDPSLERPVALKLIAPELSKTRLREPRLAAVARPPERRAIFEAGELHMHAPRRRREKHEGAALARRVRSDSPGVVASAFRFSCEARVFEPATFPTLSKGRVRNLIATPRGRPK